MQNSSTGRDREPFEPVILQTASWTIKAGIESAAGDALQRLPPTLARFWICTPPMSSMPSIKPG
jgi:hypothetical protein